MVEDSQRQEIADHLGIANISFVVVADNAEKARVIDRLAFDAAYVDGDHARDTQSDFILTARCRRVLFHEYWLAQEAVWNLVGQLQKKNSVVTEGKFALWTA